MSTIFGTNGADALRGTAFADAMYGFWGDDSLDGGQGRDFIYGGNGTDTLDGGGGSDVIDGEGGFDLALYSSSTTPVFVDLRTGSVTFPGQALPDETLLNVEALDGGSGSDSFVGNGAGNLFTGNAGNDGLSGNIGSDTLVGGVGNDSLDGGNGQDSLVGGFGNDTMLGGLHDDIFGFAPIGAQGDDGLIVLVDYGRDVIDGGGGTDTLSIEGPVVDVSEPSVFEREAPAVRANLGAGTLRMGDSANRSTLVSIENIETGSGADSINGSTGDNFISAGDGPNVVYAGFGNDTIVGGSFRLYYDGDTGAVAPVELLNGGDGDDLIYGMGSTVLSASYDTGAEYPGTDLLFGGTGNDTIHGGAGLQTMAGGTGNDFFFVTDGISSTNLMPSYEPTTITDFERGKDKIGFELSEFTDPVTFRGEMAADDVSEGDLAYYHAGTDTIVQLGIYDGYRLTIVLSDYTGRLSVNDFDLS